MNYTFIPMNEAYAFEVFKRTGGTIIGKEFECVRMRKKLRQ